MAVEKKDDQLVIGGKCFDSRFILGSGKYSLELIKAAVEHAEIGRASCRERV